MFRQIIISVLILLFGLGVAKLLISSRSEPEEKPLEAIIPLVEVVTLDVVSSNLMVSGSGTIRAREELILSPEVSGKLVYVSPDFREGLYVAQDTVLFRIDATDYQSAVNVAQSEIESKRVEVMLAEEEMALAKAELSMFDQRLNGFNNPSQQQQSPDSSRILPPEELINRASSAAQTSTISRKHSGLATREPQLRSAKAGLKRAQLQLQNAQNALQRTEVKAPFSGVVRNENIALGAYVTPGQSLGSIIGTTEFDAIIPLSESDAALIPALWQADAKPIEAVIISSYGGELYQWPAVVDRANKVLNPQTRMIDVFLRVPDPLHGGRPVLPAQSDGVVSPPLLVGSFVEAKITGKRIEQYAKLPLAALRSEDKIWLVEDNKLRSSAVDILQRLDRHVLINSEGLGVSPVVVLNPYKTATEGQQVRISRPEKSL